MSTGARLTSALAVLLALALSTGCEKAMQDMYRQPRYDPLESSSLFPDGASARTPPAGTVADITGGLAEASGGRRGTALPPSAGAGSVLPIVATPPASGDVTTVDKAPGKLPIPVTADTYQRGRERFEIFCAPCHGVLGDGDGMVVRRGFPAPPSYHSDRLRRAANQHFFNVITNGYGAMYPYADRLSPDDRWAVVAYIRALQFSQHVPVSELNAQERARLDGNGG